MVPVLEKMLAVKAHSQFATLVKTDTTFLKCSLAVYIYIKKATSNHILFPQYFPSLEFIRRKQSEKNKKINVSKPQNTATYKQNFRNTLMSKKQRVA